MEMQIIYFWPSGAWINDKETADLAIEYLGFSNYQTTEIPSNADVDWLITQLLNGDEATQVIESKE